ncbi:unnamed protein product [Notodromas monacha]|uniref:Uncharacterized protein n=1 Tax=Notodromas monacha TaxID=399045 RepID=A0A7R9BVM3_9CRUS|nr:unnamed protein product [Notodromas monacha]CAG0921430.1 unnamed protein product [Notodromas monacha]
MELVETGVLFSLLATLLLASPVPNNKKTEQITIDPQQGFMIIPPPQPHYNHDPLHGVDLLAASRSFQPPAPGPNSNVVPPEVATDALSYALQKLQSETAEVPRNMPDDPMAQQIFGDDPSCTCANGGVLNRKCQTICDFEKTIIKPEQMTVAVPQPPRYEQYVIPAPPGSCMPPTYGCRPIPQPPVYSTCTQYKKETIPLRAQFASEVDPEFLNNLDPGMAEAVVEDHHNQHHPVGLSASPCSHSQHMPIKTSAFDD